MVYFEQPEVWQEEYTLDHRQRIDELISMIPADARKILDAGCGAGALTNRLAQAGYDVVGCDLSQVALRKVSTKKCAGRVDQLMFRDNVFDLTVAGELLEHIPPAFYDQARGELARVSRKYILISVPYREVLTAGTIQCPTCTAHYHAFEHMRSYDDATLTTLLPGMDLIDKRFSGVSKRYNKLELFLRYRLGKYYSRDPHAVCPHCGMRPQTQKHGWPPLAAILAESMCRVRMLVQKPPQWFLGLYRKQT